MREWSITLAETIAATEEELAITLMKVTAGSAREAARNRASGGWTSGVLMLRRVTSRPWGNRMLGPAV